MITLFTLALAAIPTIPADHARGYLALIVGVPLKANESIESFSISTWGVEFSAVCHLPSGWTIKAGSSATPDGVLEGVSSLGATWLLKGSSPELRDLVLIKLYGPVQARDIGAVPATFKGHAIINGEDGEKRVGLTSTNIHLRSATYCPR